MPGDRTDKKDRKRRRSRVRAVGLEHVEVALTVVQRYLDDIRMVVAALREQASVKAARVKFPSLTLAPDEPGDVCERAALVGAPGGLCPPPPVPGEPCIDTTPSGLCVPLPGMPCASGPPAPGDVCPPVNVPGDICNADPGGACKGGPGRVCGNPTPGDPCNRTGEKLEPDVLQRAKKSRTRPKTRTPGKARTR
jgi:hypothetical protein